LDVLVVGLGQQLMWVRVLLFSRTTARRHDVDVIMTIIFEFLNL
jgi:hypothetical protein